MLSAFWTSLTDCWQACSPGVLVWTCLFSLPLAAQHCPVQVPVRLSTAARQMLEVLLLPEGPADPPQAGAQTEEQAPLAVATAHVMSDDLARSGATSAAPLITASDLGLRITTKPHQQPDHPDLAEAHAPEADQLPRQRQQQQALLQALLQALPKLLALGAAAAAGPGEDPSQPSGASGTSSMAFGGMIGLPSSSSLAGLRTESSLETQPPESRAPLATEPMTALLALVLSCLGQQGEAGLCLLLDLPCLAAGQLAEIVKPEQVKGAGTCAQRSAAKPAGRASLQKTDRPDPLRQGRLVASALWPCCSGAGPDVQVAGQLAET